MPEVHVRAADTRALNPDDDVAGLEVLFERLEGLVRIGDPEVVFGIGVDADIGLGGDGLGGGRGHGKGRTR